jgi:Ca-activated chloride channel family protein
MTSRFYVSLLLPIAFLSIAATLSASNFPQDPDGAAQNASVYKNNSNALNVDVNLVLVDVAVTDIRDRTVAGLERENFKVFENGVEQEIEALSTEDVPLSVGLIIDLSGSMSDKVQATREAAVQFMRTANPLDEFFLVTFNDRAELSRGFTSDIAELQNEMLFTVPHGRTALLDAVYLGLSEMRNAHNHKKVLLIISDGGDNHSRYTTRDIENLLKEADCQLFSIGIYDSIDIRSRTMEELYGPVLLSELTDVSGGRSFSVENISGLPEIAEKISIDLRNQYVLAYKPRNARYDGSWRKIKIAVHPPKGLPPLDVHAKAGYFAPKR